MKNIIYGVIAILLAITAVVFLRFRFYSGVQELTLKNTTEDIDTGNPVRDRDRDTFTMKQSGPLSGRDELPGCFDECLKSLFESVLFTDDLSVKEMNRIVEDEDYLRRFLRYNPEIIPEIGTFLATADVGDEGGGSYNEDLDNRVMLMEDVVSYLSLEDIKTATMAMISSKDLATRESSLTFIEMAFQVVEDRYDDQTDFESPPPVQALKERGELAALVTDFLQQEISPQNQLHAIDILSRNSPENMTDQVIGLLSNISTHHSDPSIRGKAIVLSAASARPDSLVLTQISDELNRPTSELHFSALLALDISLRHLSTDDPAMKNRLKEFKPDLQSLISDPETDPEIMNIAEVIFRKL